MSSECAMPCSWDPAWDDFPPVNDDQDEDSPAQEPHFEMEATSLNKDLSELAVGGHPLASGYQSITPQPNSSVNKNPELFLDTEPAARSTSEGFITSLDSPFDDQYLPEEQIDQTMPGVHQTQTNHIPGMPPIVIAVFGQTGTGKSSFIKAVTGADIEVGHGLESCTEDVLAVPCVIDNVNVVLVDTPGFSDTNFSDSEILARIATWMQDNYEDGQLLSGIIYLHRIIDVRMDGPSLKNLIMMQKLCGTKTLKNVALATTMWDKVTDKEGERREAELKEKFWYNMISKGSSVARVEYKSGNKALDLVKSLMKKRPRPTQLQEELHSGSSLIQTTAGSEIMGELKKLEQRLRSEHEDSVKELKTAQLARDRDLARNLSAALEQNRAKIARLEAEKLYLQTVPAPKKLPKVQRKGLFGLGGYHCLDCGRKTSRMGRYKCKKCGHEQRNMW